MKTITFYSYKGGVGRSLALSNIAIRLSEFKKKVCVLDFDLDAPGLHFKFHNYKSEGIKKGIVDYIYDFSCEGLFHDKLYEFSTILTPSSLLFEPIRLIPAGNIDDSSYWRKLTKINWADMFYSESAKGVKFFLDLKRKIEDEFNPDFLLIDSRTGITDISGITLKILAEEIVILAANNKENLYGSKKIINSLVNDPMPILGEAPKINFIIARLPFTDSAKDKEVEFTFIERVKNEIEFETKISNLEVLVIHSDRRLEEDERPLIGDDYEQNKVSISNDYLKLFDKLTSDVLTAEEVKVFKDKKNAEKEYMKALLEKDYTKSIQHLTAAIQLDNTRYEYYWRRGINYREIAEYDKSFSDLQHALELNPFSAELFNSLGSLYYKQKKYKEAEDFLNQAILIDSQNKTTYLIKAWIYKEQQRYEEVLNMYNQILSIAPDESDVLNSKADLNRLLGNYEEAFRDILRAIEINSQAVYFGTLAEIYASKGKVDEFYLNLIVALSKGVTPYSLRTAKDVYLKFINDKKFVTIMSKYKIDINEVFEIDS